MNFDFVLTNKIMIFFLFTLEAQLSFLAKKKIYTYQDKTELERKLKNQAFAKLS